MKFSADILLKITDIVGFNINNFNYKICKKYNNIDKKELENIWNNTINKEFIQKPQFHKKKKHRRNNMCTKTQKKLCYEKSFASFEGKTIKGKLKVDCWDYDKNKKSPNEITKGTHKKYWFKCDNCPHSFQLNPKSITSKSKGIWCPYCCVGSNTFCKDSCKHCFQTSFASFEGKTIKGKLKVDCWDYDKNKKSPNEITKGTHKKYWFKCDNCPHYFEKAICNVGWCPYCCIPSKKFCSEYDKNKIKDSCKHCFQKSFASFEGKTIKGKLKRDCWDYDKNKKSPNDFFKSSTKYAYFKCDICYHSFNSKLNNVASGFWCPYCGKKPYEFCSEYNKNKVKDSCKHCFQKSFASFEGKTIKGKLKRDCWDYDKNKKSPNEITKGTNKKYWFKCDNCPHSFQLNLTSITSKSRGSWCPYCCVGSNTFCKDSCKHCFQTSFASFEGKTIKGKLKRDCWDYDKNKKSPNEITKGTSKKYWFKCDNCPHSFQLNPNSITSKSKGSWCPYCCVGSNTFCNKYNKNKVKDSCKHCFQKSFASFEGKTIKGKLKRDCWDYDKNKKSPNEIAKVGDSEYWFTCDNCCHSFQKRMNIIIHKNSWCKYCNRFSRFLCNIKDCNHCFQRSFASFEGKTIKGKLKRDCWDYDKNKDYIPRNIHKFGDKRIFFNCDECNYIWDTCIKQITKGSWCPVCKYKTQKLLFKFLIEQYNNVEPEKIFDWSKKKYRYDFSLSHKKVLIELDGRQHFEKVSNWGDPKETRENDIIKVINAIDNGYSIIHLLQEDVYYNTYDWKTKLINTINNIEEHKIVWLDNNTNIYDFHKNLFTLRKNRCMTPSRSS